MTQIATVPELANWMSTNINWKKVFGQWKTLGSALNSDTMLFLKSVVCDKSVTDESSGALLYVDLPGCDILSDTNNLYKGTDVQNNRIPWRIEAKGDQKMFPVGTCATKEFKLAKNRNKTTKTDQSHPLAIQTFDVLMLMQTAPPYRVFLADFSLLRSNPKFVINAGAGWHAKLPMESLVCVVRHSENVEAGGVSMNLELYNQDHENVGIVSVRVPLRVPSVHTQVPF